MWVSESNYGVATRRAFFFTHVVEQLRTSVSPRTPTAFKSKPLKSFINILVPLSSLMALSLSILGSDSLSFVKYSYFCSSGNFGSTKYVALPCLSI